MFSSHVFEHLFTDEVERLVKELYRIMIPGGVCRVIVPDLEKIVTLYEPADPEEFLLQIFEVGERSKVRSAHHTGFTGASLASLFKRNGFRRTAVEDFQQGECPDIKFLDNRPGSLFFEAFK